MKDPATVDELLAEIVTITEALEDPAVGSADRTALETRRDALRDAARRAGDSARSEAGLRNELGTLTERLAEIDGRPIGKGWTEKTSYRWFNDPGAYSSQINRMLAEQDGDERARIVTRIGEIEEVLRSRSADT
jgi:hypothetical protein